MSLSRPVAEVAHQRRHQRRSAIMALPRMLIAAGQIFTRGCDASFAASSQQTRTSPASDAITVTLLSGARCGEKPIPVSSFSTATEGFVEVAELVEKLRRVCPESFRRCNASAAFHLLGSSYTRPPPVLDEVVGRAGAGNRQLLLDGGPRRELLQRAAVSDVAPPGSRRHCEKPRWVKRAAGY
ncbi:unnamed protein product [Amoebophrya sp. A120]|nr:unnamed protein product [Amoebophrya sp. A120]|eukprot:GSA120T00023190001.1